MPISMAIPTTYTSKTTNIYSTINECDAKSYGALILEMRSSVTCLARMVQLRIRGPKSIEINLCNVDELYLRF